MDTVKPTRLLAIDSLPSEMQDFALVDWATVAALTANRDVETARETLVNAGLPLVRLSARRSLPRWGALRDFIKSREQAPATAA